MRRRDFITGIAGSAAAWPLAARAQQGAMPVIGFLNSRSIEGTAHLVEAFRRGLSEGGFIEGRTVAIEYRWAGGQYDRLPALALELASRPVAVFVATGGTPTALAVRSVTKTIPIIFSIGGDPVEHGLVEGFNRPGGNATGLAILTSALEAKRLGLLRELNPSARRLIVLLNSKNPPAQGQLRDVQEAARSIGIPIQVLRASTDNEIDGAFVAIAGERDVALLVAADPFFDTRRHKLVALASNYRVPAMYQFREYVTAGGLMSYGVDLPDVYRQVGVYTTRVLKGENPAVLPIIQPIKFELVINLKAAKAIGLEVPPMLLARTDEVIE